MDLGRKLPQSCATTFLHSPACYMFDFVLLIAQTMTLSAITAWLSIGVSDNLRYPEFNEGSTSRVIGMHGMEAEYPEEFARVAHRAVRDRTWQLRLFRLAVSAELIAVALLALGLGAMVLAILGVTPAATARAFALLGAAAFTAVWSGFLVVGNYFCYWFDAEGGQSTHFQMTLWGLANMIFLSLG